MIIEYHRPNTIEQALQLLSRPVPKSYPLGGGSWLSRKRDEEFAVVDLQSLGLDEVEMAEGLLAIGATTRLQKLVENRNTPDWLKSVCVRETSRNLREMSTIAGILVTADGRSPVALAMAAANVRLHVLPGDEEISAARFFDSRKSKSRPWLITKIIVDPDIEVKSEFVARSPKDLPLVGVAVAFLNANLIRIAVGGFGEAPLIVYEGEKSLLAIKEVLDSLKSSSDHWASAAYRQAAAGAIIERLLQA